MEMNIVYAIFGAAYLIKGSLEEKCLTSIVCEVSGVIFLFFALLLKG